MQVFTFTPHGENSEKQISLFMELLQNAQIESGVSGTFGASCSAPEERKPSELELEFTHLLKRTTTSGEHPFIEVHPVDVNNLITSLRKKPESFIVLMERLHESLSEEERSEQKNSDHPDQLEWFIKPTAKALYDQFGIVLSDESKTLLNMARITCLRYAPNTGASKSEDTPEPENTDVNPEVDYRALFVTRVNHMLHHSVNYRFRSMLVVMSKLLQKELEAEFNGYEVAVRLLESGIMDEEIIEQYRSTTPEAFREKLVVELTSHCGITLSDTSVALMEYLRQRYVLATDGITPVCFRLTGKAKPHVCRVIAQMPKS